MIRFIDEYRNRFSVEVMCATLKDNREGGFISSRGYRQSKARGLSARAFRETQPSWNIFEMFMLKITASTACGKCGTPFDVEASIVAASRLPG